MDAWTPLASSNLNAFSYDAAEHILRIRFTSGRTYAYRDVPENVPKELETASSPGQYFNRSIKGSYPET